MNYKNLFWSSWILFGIGVILILPMVVIFIFQLQNYNFWG
jgi:hypothetical protein